MKFFSIVKMCVFVVGLLIGGVSVAQEYPRFSKPTIEQTGMYTVSKVEGPTLTDLQNSGALLEVIEPYSTVFGTTLPVRNYIVWGTIQTPDIYFAYQSLITNWIRYERSVEVELGKAVFGSDGTPSMELIGSGVLTFDPLEKGQGKVFDVVLNFNTPTVFYGQEITTAHLRFTRIYSNAFILACDRGNMDDGGFLPKPPENLCE